MGLVAVIDVSELNEKLVAGVWPKSTAVAPVKPEPVIVTVVPPPKGPEMGVTPVTAGAAGSAESETSVDAVESLGLAATLIGPLTVGVVSLLPPVVTEAGESSVLIAAAPRIAELLR
jgi:hypothetical protein